MSATSKWVLNEVDSPKARRLRDEWRAQFHDLITPDVFPIRSGPRPDASGAAQADP
jgi:hypothetical protein